MKDASFRSAGYALMIQENPDQKIQSKRKTYAPMAFGLKIFSSSQIKKLIYSKTFGNQHGISRVCTYFLRSNEAKNCFDRQHVSYTFLSKQTHFHQHSGMHVIMCCNSILKKHTLLTQSTPWLIFFLA